MVRPLVLTLSLACFLHVPSRAQAPAATPLPAPLPAIEDPLVAPKELITFARKAAFTTSGTPQRLQAILSAIFRSPEEGGLGITYDNSKSRTLEEVWRDRKANCLGLTCLFVAACRANDIDAKYAEPINMSHWRRNGGLVRYERHVVALTSMPPVEDIIADFMPQVRRRHSQYFVNIMSEQRVRALWASNRAVEFLEARDMATAKAYAEQAVAFDPKCGTGWNTLGVVQAFDGDSEVAEACYRKALALDRTDGSAIGNMETLLRSHGRWEESIAFRQLGIELRRRDPYFQAFLAEEALGEGRIDEAQKHIKDAIKLQPFDPDLYVTEAAIRLALGKSKDAEKSLELARKWANPKDRERFDNKLAVLKQLNS